MTGRTSRLLVSVALATGLTGCANAYVVRLETSNAAKIDLSAFRRVYLAGFLAGGSAEVDGNLETVRLIQNALRTHSDFQVVEADVQPLMTLAAKRRPVEGSEAAPHLPPKLESEADIVSYSHIFADADYWKRIGEEYQDPLIVTGTVFLMPHSSAQVVDRDRIVLSRRRGRRQVLVEREYVEQQGYILQEKIILIDGRSGAQIHSEEWRAELLYDKNYAPTALSSYFDLMDGIMPKFLNTVSAQKRRTVRVLLK